MKNVLFDLSSPLEHFVRAFEAYQREYLCKSDSEIIEEKAKLRHCLELTKTK